ncbi:aldo/keto reductase [Spirulina subsalsa]|uniref:aldo/keto reductase n=1 Tax=Spirulina subsalsa TaxID=54311 RepID=UPI0003112FA9|nr:aldo/keto reductase [Spirulina subsalsa]
MDYRRFGKTELPLSVFSLGTMRCLSGFEPFHQTLHRAIAGGINHLETAQGYGQSEVFLGRSLHTGLPLPREQLYITTKIPPHPDPKQFQTQLDQSLSRLQVDYVDGLAIHGINTPEHLQWICAPKGCLDVLEAAQRAGKVKFVGFSTHGPLELIQQAIATQAFSFVNLHYYYFFQRNAPILDLAQEQDLGVFIISPLDKGGQLYQPPEQLTQLCSPLSPMVFNYQFLLGDPRITTLSVGAAQPQDLDLVLQLNAGDAAQLREIQQRLERVLEEQLGTDLCRQCYACLPCPERISIPEVLRLRNLAIAYNMTQFGQYRYGMFGNAGHWFPGRTANHCTDCGDCLPRCPEQLDIPRLLRDSHQRLKGTSRRRLWG